MWHRHPVRICWWRSRRFPLQRVWLRCGRTRRGAAHRACLRRVWVRAMWVGMWRCIPLPTARQSWQSCWILPIISISTACRSGSAGASSAWHTRVCRAASCNWACASTPVFPPGIHRCMTPACRARAWASRQTSWRGWTSPASAACISTHCVSRVPANSSILSALLKSNSAACWPARRFAISTWVAVTG